MNFHADPHPPTLLPIFEPAFKTDPHPLYDQLREAQALSLVELPSGVRAWVATRYEVAKQMLGDARLSKSPPAPAADAPAPARHRLFDSLLLMDPPRHTALRAVLARGFSPARMAGLRPRIEAHAHSLLDCLPPRAERDLIAAYALPLPFTAICELIGIPEGERAQLLQWLADLEAADLDAPERVAPLADRLAAWFDALTLRKRGEPGDDLYTELIAAADRGEIAPAQLPALGFLLIGAGHETTANLIANGVFALLTQPGAWHRLRARPASLPRAVEELLRLDGPLEMATARYATEDLTVGDVLVRRGELVFVGLGAANHDPAQFAAPRRLDAARPGAATHLAFGHGVHACLGARLARLEGEIALRVLLQRCPGLQLAVSPEACRRKPGLITRGFCALPVRWEPAA